MSRVAHHKQRSSWPLWRALALVCATFALTFAALLPPALAASTAHGDAVVLCTPEGPRSLDLSQSEGLEGLKCASCIMASATALPAPLVVQVAAPAASGEPVVWQQARHETPPPARAPPRPPSTAPPLS
ncbi:MAG: hypothetical protein ACK4E3_11375 [Brevundimonas sp.]|jgi:hypothetical protein|uniref:hypothetical protein n=1 Tax=Brevundimonas sp. TaxID=1871086 RepID=UPI00391988CC